MKKLVFAGVCLCAAASLPVYAVDRVKADNAEPLNADISWVGGVAPTAADVAVWSNNLSGANSSVLTNAATWDGLKVVGPAGPVTIGGAALLTLDGGAATDIDLIGATQDLTIQAPVSLGGSSPYIEIAAGRTLTFSGRLDVPAGFEWNRRGAGTLIFDGAVTSGVDNTMVLFNGTTILSGKAGNLAFTSTAGSGGRFYVGRNTGSDAILIVSNGMHETRGVSATDRANFVGVSGRGRLILEGGSLRTVYLRVGVNGGSPLPSEITVNNGVLEATGGNGFGAGVYGLMIGNHYTDDDLACGASASLTVNGGAAYFTNGVVKIGSRNSGSTGAQALTLNGGVLAVRQIEVGASVQVPKTVTLNGGVLRATSGGDLFTGAGSTNGTLAVIIGDAGAIIEAVAGDAVIVPPLAASGAGELVKQGAGTLTLCGTNTYTGRTRVMSGVLRFAGAATGLHPDLAIASGAGLSLRDGALSVFSPSSLAFGTAAAVSLELELAADSSSCDKLVLPAGATLGRVAFAPVIQGSTTGALRPGDYTVMSYVGSAPDVNLFSVAAPQPNRAYSFILDADAKTVTLRIETSFAGADPVWINLGSGDWENAANWTALPANAAGARARLDNFIGAPSTVTALNPVTLGELVFSSGFSYTLAGGGFTFDNGAIPSSLKVYQGAHTVSAPLSLAGELSANPASGASVTLAGSVGGSGSLAKDGLGDVFVSAANSYSGGTKLRTGSLALSGPATLGSGTVSTEGGSGFRILGGSLITLTNQVTMSQSFNVNAAENDLLLNGPMDWLPSQVITKTGAHELRMGGTATEMTGARFVMHNGSLRFVSGAAYTLSSGDRDTFQMKENNALSRTVIIEDGARLDVDGFYMEYGTSNTIIVQGGTLNMRGGGQYNDVGLLRANGLGTDMFIVNGGQVTGADSAWFGVGIRGGPGALGALVVNGGTTTLGRVSMGVRLESGVFMGNGLVAVNGGRLNINGCFNWMADGWTSRTNSVTLGNGTPGSAVLRLPATVNSASWVANQASLYLNGGTLEASGLPAVGNASLADYLFGAKQIVVGPGGARIDTAGLGIGISQALQADAAGSGGLTKLGTGSLKLNGACAFSGATAVEQGALTIPASYASTGLVVAAGAEISLANGVIQTQQFSEVSLPSGAKVTLEALPDASACDQIWSPSGAAVGVLSVSVLQAGTSLTVSRPGDYPIFAFAGGMPTVSGWTLSNPPVNRACSFEIVGSTVVLRIAYSGGDSTWIYNGSENWGTEGNWTLSPPDAAGTVVRFDDAITAPATVSRAAGSTVGSVSFCNPNSYTLAGEALTLANAGAAPAVIASEYGVHTLTAPLVLTSNAVVSAAAGAAVALNGAVSGSTVLRVAGPGSLALPDPAALSVSGLELVDAARLVVSNSSALTTPVSLGVGGGVFAPAAGRTLDVNVDVTGSGGLTKESSSLLVVTNAHAGYAGLTTVKAGTLRLDAIPSGGIALGQGTLHYVGGGATVGSGYTLDTGSDARAGVLRADSDITFQGNVSALSGALVKTGTGTVSFTASGLNVFNAGNGAGTSHSVLDIGAYGDSPTTGFSGFNVVDGKVVIGAAGQTNLFNGLLVVGLNSTTNYNAETAGQLDVVGGETTVSDTLIVGRSNGTTNTAPVARVSKLRMTGGTLSAGTLVLGRTLVAAGHNSAPEAEISGGLLTSVNAVILGEQAGSVATLKLTGGTLVTPNITRVNGQGHVLIDNGVLRPSAQGQTMQNLTSAKVGAGGAVLDLSLADAFTLAQTLATDGADGGLTKTGGGTLTLSGKQLYVGPTLVSAGALRIAASGGLSNLTSLTVAPGAGLHLDTNAIQTVALSGLTLGGETASALTMAFAANGQSNDVFAVSGALSLGEVALTVVTAGTGEPFGVNGTYTLFTYSGDAPGVSGLSVVNPLYGKSYTFEASAGSVKMTVAADYGGASGASIWNVTTGGNWADAGNWVSAPGAGGPGQQVRFDDKITSAAAVSVASPVTVGAVYFNNTNAYTLSGAAALTLDNGAGTQAVVSVESGTHTVSAPVAIGSDGATVNAPLNAGLTLAGPLLGAGALTKVGAGDLTVTQTNSRSGKTEMKSGVLILQGGGTPGAGELVMAGSPGVRVTGSGAQVTGPVTIKNAMQANALDGDLTLSGLLDWQSTASTVTKVGTNQMVLAGTGSAAGTPTLNVREGGLRVASGANYSFANTTRESIKLGAGTNAKTYMTIESGASLTLGGLSAKADASTTGGGDTLITQNGGAVSLNYGDALFVRHDGTAPATYVMNGGTLTMPSASWANAGLYGPGNIVVNGGVMSLGRFAPGYQNRTTSNGNAPVSVTVNGGRLEATGSWSWMSDGNSRMTDVRLEDGVLSIPATRTYGTSLGRWTSLLLNGGMLETRGAALDVAATDDYLAGARRVALGAEGATIHTLGNDVTFRQNVQALTLTGGVTKVGGGTLTLAGTNVLWGLADVREGTLKARFKHRNLPGTPLFWYGMDSTSGTNVDLTGHGLDMVKSGAGALLPIEGHVPGSQALTLTSGVWFTTMNNNTVYSNTAAFTVSAWIRVTYKANDSNQSIISTRSNNDKAFELKLNNPGNELRLLENSTGSWWQDIRSVGVVPYDGSWVHVAATVAPPPGFVALYINGVRQSVVANNNSVNIVTNGYLYPGDIRFAPIGRSTCNFQIGRTGTTQPAFKGSIDEVMLFDRVLSDGEVAQLYSESPLNKVSVRVADMGTLDLFGDTQRVSEASGSGRVVNGTLAVEKRLAPGDTDGEAPGSVLEVANLTLGTNMVYACSCNGLVSDVVDVSGLLTVDGAGVIDLGRTPESPVSGSFSAVVMTYGAVSGAANFSGWTVTGLGRRGYKASVKAEAGEVILTLDSTTGTLLYLK